SYLKIQEVIEDQGSNFQERKHHPSQLWYLDLGFLLLLDLYHSSSIFRMFVRLYLFMNNNLNMFDYFYHGCLTFVAMFT
ncbi:hypothetical protein ACMBCN_03120, partial [Candidatus Liberibacter asiaticus]|nr:hypothetical protein [Candidatus Liberibacter asiaticus]